MFSYEFCEIFKNTLFTEHMWLTGSVCTSQQNGKILNSYNRFFARILYLRKICTPPGFFNLHETYMRNLYESYVFKFLQKNPVLGFISWYKSSHKKWSFPSRISSVCVTKSTGIWRRLYCELWTDFTQCFDVSVVDLGQINAGLVLSLSVDLKTTQAVVFSSTSSCSATGQTTQL